MGADVIKVEPLNGEHFRPHFGGAWVPSMNRNKRGLALDLRSTGGRDVLMRLVKKADVFMEAFTPGVIDKLGFGWDVVSKENPRCVYASVSGYGQTGPYSGRAGYDPCIQAEIGLMDATGPYQGEMCRVGTAPIDYSTGLACAGGIAFALLHRHKTFFFFSSRRRHTSSLCDWSSDVCSSDLVGAGLLWLGWNGFNGGDPYYAGADMAAAVVNTNLATGAGVITWMIMDALGSKGKKPTFGGGINGMICGLVGITPCAGWVDGWGALAVGLI